MRDNTSVARDEALAAHAPYNQPIVMLRGLMVSFDSISQALVCDEKPWPALVYEAHIPGSIDMMLQVADILGSAKRLNHNVDHVIEQLNLLWRNEASTYDDESIGELGQCIALQYIPEIKLDWEDWLQE